MERQKKKFLMLKNGQNNSQRRSRMIFKHYMVMYKIIPKSIYMSLTMQFQIRSLIKTYSSKSKNIFQNRFYKPSLDKLKNFRTYLKIFNSDHHITKKIMVRREQLQSKLKFGNNNNKLLERPSSTMSYFKKIRDQQNQKNLIKHTQRHTKIHRIFHINRQQNLRVKLTLMPNSCIRSSEDYQQSKQIKQSVQNDEKHNFDLILDTIKKLFHDKNIQAMGQLMIIRLCKDLIDTMNLDFVEQFEQKVLLELRPFAEFKMPSQDANRGATFFDRHSDPAYLEKKLKTLGTSIVRLSLDCIQAWAQFFPQDLKIKNTPSMYMKFYQELVKKGVHFPPWAYYKKDYINEHKSHDYDRIVKIIAEQQKDPQNLLQMKQLEQIPGGGPALKPMTPMDPQKIKTDALAVIQQCKELSKKTSVLCSRTLVTDYQKNLFHEIYDEAYAKHMEMDQIVNNLLEIDDEELATEIMGEMDELQILIDDIKQYQQMQGYWPMFRKKYIKNPFDLAVQQSRGNRRVLGSKDFF